MSILKMMCVKWTAKCVLIILLQVFVAYYAVGQSWYAPLDKSYYHLVDREEVLQKNVSQFIHSSFKPYRRSDIVATIDSVSRTLSAQDEFNQYYLQQDNWPYNILAVNSKRPVFKHFYKHRADFYHVDHNSFMLRVNPILYLGMGRDGRSASTPFINTRGVVVQGTIDNKISFYSSIEETQAVFPKYVQDYITTRGAVPNEAFWKTYKIGGVDFFTARGYVAVKATKHIDIQFGYDKNFLGNGYRSLFLSDFSAPSTFLKIQTKVWKLQYTNLYSLLTANAPWSAVDGSNGFEAFPTKFMTAHHLSINLVDNFNVSIYEAIMFSRGNDAQSAFELNYLNPILFYRAIEQHTGSPDNAIIGLDWKWNIATRIQIYGQLLLDELVVSEIKNNSGWWANKYAIQGGFKYINAFGISNLDLRGEANIARPFTYSHSSNATNFTNYNMPLAHPLGANFKELLLVVCYQPTNRLIVNGTFIVAKYGRDTANENLGGDIFKSYIKPTKAYGNTIGQGIASQKYYAYISASYMLKQNLFFDLKHIYRRISSDDSLLTHTTNFTTLSIRLNLAQRDLAF